MTVQTTVFLQRGATVRAGQIQGDPFLVIDPDPERSDVVTLHLGNSLAGDSAAVVLDQLRALHRAIAQAAKPYGGLLAVLGPDDDEDDEADEAGPTLSLLDMSRLPAEFQTAIAGTIVDIRTGQACAAHGLRRCTFGCVPDGDHYAYPDSLERTGL